MRRARLLAVVVDRRRRARSASSRRRRPGCIVVLDDGAAHTLAVPGAAAVPVLAPAEPRGARARRRAVDRRTRAALRLRRAHRRDRRRSSAWLTAQVAFAHPIVGRRRRPSPTRPASPATTPSPTLVAHDRRRPPWPFVTLVGWIVLLAAGVVHPRDGAPLAGERATLSHGCRGRRPQPAAAAGIPPARRDRLVGRPLAWRGSDGLTARLTTPPRVPGGDQ